jgi:hypothetical protein
MKMKVRENAPGLFLFRQFNIASLLSREAEGPAL